MKNWTNNKNWAENDESRPKLDFISNFSHSTFLFITEIVVLKMMNLVTNSHPIGLWYPRFNSVPLYYYLELKFNKTFI